MNERIWNSLVTNLLAEGSLWQHYYLPKEQKDVAVICDGKGKNGKWVFDKKLNVITLEEYHEDVF